jgi:hypothetical protein
MEEPGKDWRPGGDRSWDGRICASDKENSAVKATGISIAAMLSRDASVLAEACGTSAWTV